MHESIEKARQRVVQVCRSEKVDVNLLKNGSRRRDVSAVRTRLAMELTASLGLSSAETARQLGVSTSAIAKTIERNQ